MISELWGEIIDESLLMSCSFDPG